MQACAAAHGSTTLPSSFHVVIGAYTPARSTAQGETAAILGQGPPLLVHAGGVHFNRHDVVDSRLRFDLILPALPEEVNGQIRGVLCAVEHLDRPYVDLKARLLKLFTPKPVDNCLKLIHSPELGDRRPIQLMEAMLALLPPGTEDDILFKILYVTKLPKKVTGLVLGNSMHLNSRELSDDLWCGLNE